MHIKIKYTYFNCSKLKRFAINEKVLGLLSKKNQEKNISYTYLVLLTRSEKMTK